MSRILAFLIAAVTTSGLALAQSPRLAPNASKTSAERPVFDRSLQPIKMELDVPTTASPDASPLPGTGGPRALTSIPTTDWATMVGYTFYDLQTYGSNSNLIQNYADGDLSITYMLGHGRTRGSRMAGYNHYDAIAGRWTSQASVLSPGSKDDSTFLAASPLARGNAAPVGSEYLNGRVGWPNLIHTIDKEAIVSYGLFGNAPNTRLLLSTIEAGGNGKFGGRADDTPLFDTLARNRGTESVFHVTATDGVTSYALTTAWDTSRTRDLLATGTVNNLLLYRTTNNGRNWTRIIFDDISISNGVGGVKDMGAAVDCRGSEVAVVTTVMLPRPNSGLATWLFRSSDYGATWRKKVISQRTTADTSFRIGENYCLSNDGASSIVIDNNNKAHVTTHLGYQTLDSTGMATATFFRNGGFANMAQSKLLYFNEDMPELAGFRELTGLVDVDRNGALSFPGNTSTAAPGIYPHSGLSMSNLTVGPNNELFITYSALVEGTHLTSNTRVTRDIYVMASYDGGTTWSNPINVAGRLAIVNGRTFDDGTSGSGQYEEAFPHAIKRIGTDGKLHMIFMSDEIAGMAESPTGNFSLLSGWPTWRSNAINHCAIPIADIANSQLRITSPIPTQVCAGSTGTITVVAPANPLPIYGPITSNSVFIVEMDTSGRGTFNPVVMVLGTFTGNASGGNISINYPSGFMGLAHIRVRVNNGDPTASPPLYQSESAYFPVTIVASAPAATLGAITTKLSNGGVLANGGVVCSNTSIKFYVPASLNANQYVWTMTPSNAGSIQVNGDAEIGRNHALATFNEGATGTVTVSVKAINGCGETATPSTFTFSIGSGTATYVPATQTLISSVTGGQWQRSARSAGPFVNLPTPVTAAVLHVDADPLNTPKETFYRYQVTGGCATSLAFATDLALLRCGVTPPVPTITATGPTTICAGGSVTLTVPSGYRYLWSNDMMGESITVSDPGVYTVRAINGRCASVASMSVEVAISTPPTPSITTAGGTTICAGESTTLSAPAGFRYRWSNGDTTQNISVSAAGSYTVRIIANGCTSMVSPATAIAVTPRPNASLTSQNDTMTASPAGASYQWILNGTPVVGETGRGLRATVSGRYQVIVTLNGCADTSAALQITSILDRGQRATLTLSPNPATSTLHLTLSSGIISQVQVLDQLGRMLINITELPDNKLDVSSLAAGTYVVRVVTDSGVVNRAVSVVR